LQCYYWPLRCRGQGHTIRIPFHDADDLVVVDVKANGKPAFMLVDAGANVTLLRHAPTNAAAIERVPSHAVTVSALGLDKVQVPSCEKGRCRNGWFAWPGLLRLRRAHRLQDSRRRARAVSVVAARARGVDSLEGRCALHRYLGMALAEAGPRGETPLGPNHRPLTQCSLTAPICGPGLRGENPQIKGDFL
jgi:hypothetical protein